MNKSEATNKGKNIMSNFISFLKLSVSEGLVKTAKSDPKNAAGLGAMILFVIFFAFSGGESTSSQGSSDAQKQVHVKAPRTASDSLGLRHPFGAFVYAGKAISISPNYYTRYTRNDVQEEVHKVRISTKEIPNHNRFFKNVDMPNKSQAIEFSYEDMFGGIKDAVIFTSTDSDGKETYWMANSTEGSKNKYSHVKQITYL